MKDGRDKLIVNLYHQTKHDSNEAPRRLEKLSEYTI